MRIGVLGGGPAGLYFALLAKRADPDHEITVVERNAPDATFGWGVVFSEETLGALRDADYPSYVEITDTFARWSAIDVVYGGRTVRSGGHGFSAIARRRLLEILQRRCREVGVELAFHREVPDLDTFADRDLVVAADGVNSTARRLLEPHLRPTLDVHRSKFVWFGTDLPLDAFTFIFRTTPHGMFQVHAYPFDADTSTFIVECTEGTWRAAGLEEAGESESIAFCQDLFGPELGGHKLLSNRSLWISFVTVRCQSWHHGNVVLLGDAAHTAHFTIGSGTKLAMEDAVALGQALQRHPDDLAAAFTDYELERQPVVERFQEAARDSATWFENVRRYDGFDPVQFACNLLTRSGRIGHLELTRRDPGFAARVDRLFAGRPETLVAPPPLFAPLAQRAVTLGNRVALAVASEDDAADGRLPGRTARRLADTAGAGAGVVVSELVAVAPDG
ncbi:MAG TPA: FAD-dependent monooxygenase, partial [Actinomycetes bacterium]|nr:FAD-dependent monooxygenase [Actinomycetes bacterium]